VPPGGAVLTVVTICVLLVGLTTLLHYEVLRGLSDTLPSLPLASRAKVLVVIVGAFLAHAAEMALYGVALYVLVSYLGAGVLAGGASVSLLNCLYFSAETYTSLGFGDLTPVGPARLLAGTEALNGLLLIGWSSSFAYLSMEKFWNSGAPRIAGHDVSERRRNDPSSGAD
jgi:hypothetical protein